MYQKQHLIYILVSFHIFICIACNAPDVTDNTSNATYILSSPTIIPTPTLNLEKEIERVTSNEIINHIPNGILSFASPGFPDHFDVHEENSNSLLSMGPGISYSRLLKFDGKEILCDLCLDWEQVSNIEYIFHIRDDIYWHDKKPVSGRKLITKDIVYSLNRVKNNDWFSSSIINSIDMVEEIGRSKMRILLKYPDSDILMRLAHGNIKIVPFELLNLRDGLRFGPTIGTGPWIFNEDSVDRFDFVANPNYFETDLPQAKEFVITPVSSENTRIALVLSEKINISLVDYWSIKRLLNFEDLEINQISISNLKSSNFDKFEDCLSNRYPCINVIPNYSKGIIFALNSTRYALDDVLFRRYIFSHLDLNSYESLSIGLPITSKDWKLNTKSESSYTNIPQLAASIKYDLSNSANIERLNHPLNFYVGDYGDEYMALGIKYHTMLSNAGINVNLEFLNPKEYYEKVWVEQDYDLTLGPKIPTDIPNAFLYGMIHSTGRYSITNHQLDFLDSIIEKQNSNDIDRSGHIIDLQRYVLENALLFEPITDYVGILIGNNIQNYSSVDINIRNAESLHWAELAVSH